MKTVQKIAEQFFVKRMVPELFHSTNSQERNNKGPIQTEVEPCTCHVALLCFSVEPCIHLLLFTCKYSLSLLLFLSPRFPLCKFCSIPHSPQAQYLQTFRRFLAIIKQPLISVTLKRGGMK